MTFKIAFPDPGPAFRHGVKNTMQGGGLTELKRETRPRM
jgi:hypothetical protein